MIKIISLETLEPDLATVKDGLDKAVTIKLCLVSLGKFCIRKPMLLVLF